MSSTAQVQAHPTGWTAASLGAVANYVNGYPFRPEQWKDVGTPIIRIAQMTDQSTNSDRFPGALTSRYRIDDGDLLFSWSATLMTLIWTSGPAYINQHIFKVVPRPGIDVGFLHHLLDFSMEDLAARSHGTTMRHITQSDLLPFRALVPPLAEQRRIAAILDTLDDAIRKTEAIIAKLRLVKQGLLNDLLTRGIDDSGELRSPPNEVPDLYKESPLGRIPRNWRCMTIDELAVHVGSGLTPRGGSDVYLASGTLFIRSQNVHFDGLRLDDAAFIDARTHAQMRRSEVFAHDVLLNITGASIGRCCPVPDGLGQANVNQHVCAIRLQSANRLDAVFLSEFLGSPFGQSQVDLLNAGSNREGLNYQQVRRFVVSWPDKEERARFASQMLTLGRRKQAEEYEAEKLKALRLGLMDDLLTGRVRVHVPERATA